MGLPAAFNFLAIEHTICRLIFFLSATDILVALYFNILNHNPQDPRWPDRDRSAGGRIADLPSWQVQFSERKMVSEQKSFV